MPRRTQMTSVEKRTYTQMAVTAALNAVGVAPTVNKPRFYRGMVKISANHAAATTGQWRKVENFLAAYFPRVRVQEQADGEGRSKFFATF